jgi:hypothetical protein
MFLNMLLRAFALQAEARGLSDPMRQYFRLADLWRELALLHGEPVPADVAAICVEHPFSGIEEKPDEEPEARR